MTLPHGETCCKGLKKDLKTFTKSQFLEYAMAEKNDAYIFAAEGLVCRIGRHTWKHPGGHQVFEDIHACDATERIEAAHRTDKHVYARLKSACVGKLVDQDCLVPQIDRELRQLKRECEKEGLFELSNAKGFGRTIEPLVLIFVGVACLQVLQLGWYSWAIMSSIATLGYLRLLWWMHDSQHHALFPDGRTTQIALDFASFVFLGCYTRQAFREHSIHHAFVNVLDHDWTKEFMHIFEVAPEHAGNFPSSFKNKGMGQVILWYGLALPMFGMTKVVGSLKEAHAKGWWWRTVLMMMRMAVMIQLGAVWSMFVLPQTALFILGFVAVLNHLHMPMVKHASPLDCNDIDGSESPLYSTALRRAAKSDGEPVFNSRTSWGPRENETTGNVMEDEIRASWTYAMVAPSCSVAPDSNLYAYVSGGLNYHIEHHLFPCMVSTNLHRTRDRVKDLLDKYGLPYATASFMGALSSTAMQMWDPSRVVESPVPKPRKSQTLHEN